MIEAVRVIRRAGRAFLGELYVLFVLSILTVLCLPLLVPFPPALAGLWSVARRIAEGRVVRVQDGWEGFKRYFFPAWGLALVNIAAYSLMFYNMVFYANLPFPVPDWMPPALQAFWTAALIVWSGWQLFALAVLVEQERPHVLQALGQALALMGKDAVFTLTLLTVESLLIALGMAVLGLGIFVLPGALAILTVYAVRHLWGKETVEP